MDRRRLAAATLLVGGLVAVAWVVADVGAPEPTADVDNPHPTERTLDYWTDERVREAEPAPMPTVD